MVRSRFFSMMSDIYVFLEIFSDLFSINNDEKITNLEVYY